MYLYFRLQVRQNGSVLPQQPRPMQFAARPKQVNRNRAARPAPGFLPAHGISRQKSCGHGVRKAETRGEERIDLGALFRVVRPHLGQQDRFAQPHLN